ncbi:hypothetical protein EDD86DRAFT_230891 [Gorgonomyces haynaldii]|nr:hypothetical protein EDD86DRAFT_230891 [Gorgonomyces haynaldii]
MKQVFSVPVKGSLFKWQKATSKHLAVATPNSVVIYTRDGQQVESILTDAEVLEMEWSENGLYLAVLVKKPIVYIWDNTNLKSFGIDTGAKSLENMAWDNLGETLSFGTGKGNLLLLEVKTAKKTPIIGKHTKPIVSLDWGDNILACASLDRSFSLSNSQGDTLIQLGGLRGDPSKVKWIGQHSEKVAIVVGSKALFIYTHGPGGGSMELGFDQNYGSVVDYHWYKDKILLGFSKGYLVTVSTKKESLGKELFHSKCFREELLNLKVCEPLNMVACCGDHVVKIFDLSNLNDVNSVLHLDQEKSTQVGFSPDGSYLTVSSKDGHIYTYSCKVKLLSSSRGNRVAFVTDKNELVVSDTHSKIQQAIQEPLGLSLGGCHVLLQTESDSIRFVEITPQKSIADEMLYNYHQTIEDPVLGFTGVTEQVKYSGTVLEMQANWQYCVCLMENGTLQLHPIDQQYFAGSRGTITLPEDPNLGLVKSVLLTDFLLVFGTDKGDLVYYDLEELSQISHYRHQKPVQKLYGQPKNGSKIVFVDDTQGFVYSPTIDPLAISGWSEKTLGALWSDRSVFVTWESNHLTTHVLSNTLQGRKIISLSETTHLSYGYRPLLFYGNAVVCQNLGGKIDQVELETHKILNPQQLLSQYPTDAEQGKQLRTMYLVGLREDIWSYYPIVHSKKAWLLLAEQCLQSLDVSFAKRIYQQVLNDGGMVLCLERLQEIEDRMELMGHIAGIFQNFSLALQYFMNSENPKEALYLQTNLLEYESALELAKKYSPGEIPIIALDYALQLELDSKSSEAQSMFELALRTMDTHKFKNLSFKKDHLEQCQTGLVRTTFKLGDIHRGMTLLNVVSDKKLILECVQILQGLKWFNEAGQLLEKAEQWEQAAEIWVKLKNWSKVSQLADKIQSPRLYKQIAATKEAEGQYPDAATAYEKAKDYDNVARILVDHLHDLQGGANLVRVTKSRESAKKLAKLFTSSRRFQEAIEFYMIAGMQDEAFDLAKNQEMVHYFGELVLEDASVGLLTTIAQYFESKGDYFNAGKYQYHALHYPEALRLFLNAPVVDEPSIDYAITIIGEAKNDQLTHELIDFLMGETDGMPKDAKYIFKLYMSLKQFKEAARTAVIIAREEQVIGNYRGAHDLLLDNYKQLLSTGGKVPAELDRMLMILHSYILVKTLVKMNDHEKASRMLIRVSNNVSKFPAHVVPILTSTVIECHRSGFKKEAFDFAALLMRPEYRQKLDSKFKNKIEQVIRRPEMDTVEEHATPCPYCDTLVPETVLDCDTCKNKLPYCIATGQHMILKEWSVCPHCSFPAICSYFKELLRQTGQCPMCSESLDETQVYVVDNPQEYLQGKPDLEEFPVNNV